MLENAKLKAKVETLLHMLNLTEGGGRCWVLAVSGGVALVAALVATATGGTAGAATLARHLVNTARLHITMYLYL